MAGGNTYGAEAPKSKLSVFASFLKERMGGPNGSSGNGNGNKKSWAALIFQFTQDTTFHGVRYITADTPYISRRVLWTTVVLLATSFFFWFMSDRLTYLYSHPKAVDVEVIYTDDVRFPAVTICNQNVFRMSATHRLGLLDIVEESFVKIQSGGVKKNETDGKESWQTGFERFANQRLVDVPDTLATYVDVSAKVCRHLCLTRHGDSCCSVVYDRRSATCYVTPADMTSSDKGFVKEMYVDHFHRKKCQVQSSASCSFEDGLCAFVKEDTQSLSWKPVNKDTRADVKFPQYDHTFMSSIGSYLLAATKFNQPGSFAHLVSPYISSYGATCVQFYYQLRGGALNVKTKSHHSEITTIWSHQYRPNSRSVQLWERGIQRLPTGYYRIILEAATSQSNELLNVAVDDVTIGLCPTEHTCKESVSGKGYAGYLSTTASNTTCKRWELVPPFLRPMIWRSQDAQLVDKTISELENYCRNPDDDPSSPWCITDLSTGEMEYCDIPLCACREVEFACDNGRCVSSDLICDGEDDCGDLSDEFAVCNFTKSLGCSFSHDKACGYRTVSGPHWVPQLIDGTDGVYGVLVSDARQGDVSVLMSPSLNMTSETCIRIDYLLTEGSSIDIFLQTTHIAYQGRELICTLGADTSGGLWNYTHIMLPNGTYNLVFSAILGDPSLTQILVDNITLLTENCTEIIREIEATTMETLTTLDYVTTDNSTDNMTDAVTTEQFTTMAMTTMMPNATEEPEVPPDPIQMCASTVPCRSCYKEFSDGNDCGYQFRLVYDEVRGLASRCLHVNTTRRVSVRGCMHITRTYGANAFNFKKRRCYIKYCENWDLELSQNYGGFNIYKLYESHEKFGISCSFLDRCACGYKYMSSNLHQIWVRKKVTPDDKEDEDEEKEKKEMKSFNNTLSKGNGTGTEEWEDEDDKEVSFYMTVKNTLKLRPREQDWSRLVSPIEKVVNESCLTFYFFTRYVDIKVYSYNQTEERMLVDILHDGQVKAWHKVSLDLSPDEYGLIFEFRYAEQAPEHAGIRDINMKSGKCYDEEVYGSFNCTFVDEDYCGYQDASSGPVKWIRSKEYSDASPGSYYLRTSDHLEHKSSNMLLSPYQLVTNTSCLHFYYFLQGTGHQGALVNTLSLSLDHWRDAPETVWSVRAITDNSWHTAQIEVPEGYYRLRFVMSGEQMRGGLDDVIITEGICPNITCSQEEATCTAKFTCIPHGLACDGVPNCHEAEDEISCNIMGNTTEEIKPAVDEVSDNVAHSINKPPTTNRPIGVAMNLTEIYMRTAHQGQDFIYSCKWEGHPCSYVNLTKQVTDYGVCYTFNNRKHIVKTAKTGSRFGLSLTLNIEQYDYMNGPQSDAGIKVFLHTKEELPQVRDLGFAIPPGTHTLVGIRLNEAENLEAPWGDCAVKDLYFYDKYIHSACVRECETFDVIKQCGCRDAYMPVLGDYPPICNLTTYFDCALPAINKPSLGHKQCKCPKPCYQTVFEPSLSSASLSYLSVGYILRGNNVENLRARYHQALDAKQRVSEKRFKDDLKLLKNVLQKYQELIGYARSNLGDMKSSKFAKMDTASQTLVDLAIADIKNLLEDVESYSSAYNSSYSDTIDLLHIYLGDTKVCLKEVDQLLTLSIRQNATHRFFTEVSRRCITQSEMMHETLQGLIADLEENGQGSPAMQINRQTRKLPKTLFADEELCHNSLSKVSATLKRAALLLEGFEDQTDGETLGPFDKERVNEMREGIFTYMTYFNTLKECLGEYDMVLEKTRQRMASMTKELSVFKQQNVLLGNNYNLTSESHILEQDEENVNSLYQKYIYNKVSKLDYLEQFKPDDQSSTDLSNINTFVERIENRLTTPLRSSIQSIRDSLLKYYMEALRDANHLEKYLDDFIFYEKSSKMKIWREPIPNLDSPERVNDKGREHWKVWNRDMTMRIFVRDHAKRYIHDALMFFCDQLLKEVDSFEEQLIFNKQKLIDSMADIQTAYLEFVKQRSIAHRFVLDNFLTMDVYFAQLKHQTVKQIRAYELTQFLGDVGGFMGLLLGGSVLTVFELIDLLVFNFIKKLVARRDEEERERERMERILGRARLAEERGENDVDDATLRPIYSSSSQNGEYGGLTPAKYDMPKDAIPVHVLP